MPEKQQISPLVTLTTDLGTSDHYVAVLKAVMLGINPAIQFVDISHNIPPQDIMACAWVVKNAAFYFPKGTVHLVAVDPTTGTSRNPLVVKINDQIFVGPDNGVFSLIADQQAVDIFQIDKEDFWSKTLSNTFHARDIFAPVAAHLASGIALDWIGKKIDSMVNYRWAIPTDDHDSLNGWVVHIDRFGNLITNISKKLVHSTASGRTSKVYAGNTIITGISTSFANVPESEALAYFGSSDMLEVAINKGNAQQMLGVEKGTSVTVLFKD
jgi:S-adenosyl-L-methionine hydrolase (adenosine-forming)